MKNDLLRHWGLCGVLIFWLVLLAINVLDLFPGVRFRGIRYHGPDFDQYYTAGVVAQERLWHGLYPPDMGTASTPHGATLHPDVAAELARRQATSRVNNVAPPPLAVFAIPLAMLPFHMAYKAFAAVQFLATLWFLLLFRKECDEFRLPPNLANALVLVVGTGLPVCESLMLANSTTFVALATILALRSVRHSQTASSVFAFALAGLLKGFSAVWVPALVIWKRWRTILWGAVCGTIILTMPHLLGAGLDVWQRFFSDVLHTANGTPYWIGDQNLGLPSFFAWLYPNCPMPRPLSVVLAVGQPILLVAAYTLGWRASRFGETLAMGLSLFLATLSFQLFSPHCWPHYAFNVVGFLPLAFSASGVRTGCRLHGIQWFYVVIVALAFALSWFPIGNAAKYVCHAPILGFGRTFGYLLMLFWGFVTLIHMAFHHE